MDDLYIRIESLCKDNGTNITAMCKGAGISRASMSELKMGRNKTLSYDTLSKIADYFHVSIDYLAGNEQKEKPALEKDEPDITFDDFTYALHNEAKELTDENKQKLLEMAKLFKLSQEQDKNKK